MNCEDFEKLVITLARNQLMKAAIREQSLAHAEICGRCRTRLRAERTLLSGINAVVAEITGERAPARVETALLAAFRAQTRELSSVMALQNHTRNRWSWKLAAVAAGILMLISVMAIFWRSASPFVPITEERTFSRNPVAPPQVPPVAPELFVAEKPEDRPKRVRHRAFRNVSDETELVTQLFELREGEYLSALESLQLVRVELPGSALSELGLLIDPETANESVKADVLLGPDGLARAIRFVR